MMMRNRESDPPEDERRWVHVQQKRGVIESVVTGSFVCFHCQSGARALLLGVLQAGRTGVFQWTSFCEHV